MSDIPPSIRCPNCQAEVPVPAAVRSRSRSQSRSIWRRWRTPLVLGGVVLIACLGLVYRYRGQAETVLNLANEATGSTSLSVTVLAASAFLALCLLGWLLLPLLLAGAYLDFRCRRDPALGFGLPHPADPVHDAPHSPPQAPAPAPTEPPDPS